MPGAFQQVTSSQFTDAVAAGAACSAAHGDAAVDAAGKIHGFVGCPPTNPITYFRTGRFFDSPHQPALARISATERSAQT